MSELVSTNVRRTRDRRGLSVRQLSDRLAALGYRLLPSGVTNIESRDPSRRRRVDVDDLAALALALKTTPAALLAASDDARQPVALTPERAVTAWVFDRWVRGVGYPTPHIEKHDDQLIFDAASEDVQRQRSLDARRHAARAAVQRLGSYVDTAIEALDDLDAEAAYVGTTPEDRRAALARLLQGSKEQAVRFISVLEEELLEAERTHRQDSEYTFPDRAAGSDAAGREGGI